MIDKVCKNCKHCVDCEVYSQNYGLTCESPKTIKSYKVNTAPEGGIWVENDEGWGIIVSPTFGCVNWEPK